MPSSDKPRPSRTAYAAVRSARDGHGDHEARHEHRQDRAAHGLTQRRVQGARRVVVAGRSPDALADDDQHLEGEHRDNHRGRPLRDPAATRQQGQHPADRHGVNADRDGELERFEPDRHPGEDPRVEEDAGERDDGGYRHDSGEERQRPIPACGSLCHGSSHALMLGARGARIVRPRARQPAAGSFLGRRTLTRVFSGENGLPSRVSGCPARGPIRSIDGDRRAGTCRGRRAALRDA